MLGEISAREFAEWMAYSHVEPWGEERADLRAGIVASVMANTHRGKNQKTYKAQDFMPDFTLESEDEAGARLMAAAFVALGGRR